MTRQSKSVLFAVVITILLTAFMFTCFATDGTTPTDPPVNPTSAPTTETPVDPPSDAPTTDPSETPSDTPTTDPSENPSDVPTEAPTDDNNHYDDFNNYGDGDNDGIPDNTDNTVDDVENDTTQFPTSEMERPETQWTNITLDKNSNTNSAKSFKAIKENTTTNDFSKWILIIGIVLLTISAIGITYFIIAMVTYSKQKKEFNEATKKNAEKRRAAVARSASTTSAVSTYDSSHERTVVATDNKSEEFLTAADYYNKIRHSNSNTAPKHSASDKGKHYK